MTQVYNSYHEQRARAATSRVGKHVYHCSEVTVLRPAEDGALKVVRVIPQSKLQYKAEGLARKRKPRS